MATYCKVVFRDAEGKFTSAFIGGQYNVEYTVGEWARPKEGCGPLCVFNSAAAAENFATTLFCCWHPSPSLLCFECEIEPSKHEAVWRKGDHEVFHVKIYNLPSPTVLADAVKLGVQLIDIEERLGFWVNSKRKEYDEGLALSPLIGGDAAGM